MSELIITNDSNKAGIEPFIIEKLTAYGPGILDPRHFSFSNEEKFKIMHMKYWQDLVYDAIKTGHFVRGYNGEVRVAIWDTKQDVSVIAGYIFEAYTVRHANNFKNFGFELFKWITMRKRLSEKYFDRYQAVGVGFPITNSYYPGYYNPSLRQFDVIFLTMNDKFGRPEPATLLNSNIQAGVQIKAITSNELTQIIQPLINGQYTKVLTYLKRKSGKHSYQVCMDEVKRLYKEGQITEEVKNRLVDSIACPDMFGLDQRDVDDYYNYIRAWYAKQAEEDETILKALGIQSQEMIYGTSFITEI